VHQQIHVIAKLKLLQDVDQEQPVDLPDVEIDLLHNAKLDVNHLNHHNLQTHVIAKLLQFQDVEIHQPVDLPDVEITKLQHVELDVHQHHNHVIAKQLQLQNVDLD
jgi:hypothetical protein